MRRRFLNNIKSISGDNHSEYFTIEALEDGLTAKLSTNTCEYRIDDGSWNTLYADSDTPSINKGQTLSFKGNLTPTLSKGIGTFTISKKCNLKGNIMSLLYEDNFIDKNNLTSNYIFTSLFSVCKNVVEAHNLILPATKLTVSCYDRMFAGCTSLTTAPELPSTTLAGNCYNHMFYNTNVLPDCSNIDFTNETVVAVGGLRGLFCGTKVTDADLELILPKNNEGKYCLPVTTLARFCYDHMFSDCSNLTTAPELPATTLVEYCYNHMFSDCSKLNHITMLATDISASRCLDYWVDGVASTGTFVKHPNMTSLPSGVSGIPSGWTVENYITNLITFTIDGIEYQAEEGMTFEDWCNSEYNIDGFISYGSEDYVVNADETHYICDNNYNFMPSYEIIKLNCIYKLCSPY